MPTDARYANGHRRRQIRLRVLAEEDTCALCGNPVDKGLRLGADGKPHPYAPEVDEIIPVSLGGSPLLRSNTQLAHRICNQRKGNGARQQKPPTPAKRLTTSQTW